MTDKPTARRKRRSATRSRYVKPWLTPAGAGVTVLCFFLPWVRINCAGSHTLTGADVAGDAGGLWLVVITAAVTLVTCTVFYFLGRIAKAKPIAIWGPLIGIGALAFEGVRHWDGIRSGIKVMGVIGVGVALQIGFYGTLAGLVAGLIGGIATHRHPTRRATGEERSVAASTSAGLGPSERSGNPPPTAPQSGTL